MAGPASGDSLARATALSPEMAQYEEEREKWQRIPEMFAALGIKEGSSVADVGAGEGFFTLRLARAVGPSGRVFAIDIDKKVLKTLRARLRKGGFNNVRIIHGKADDPELPANSIDAALFVGSYHEMKAHQAMLQHVHQALKPDGRIVVVERLTSWDSIPREEEARETQEKRHDLGPKFVDQDLQDAHFRVLDQQKAFLRSVQEFSLTTASPAR